jgi:hypothetical protein
MIQWKANNADLHNKRCRPGAGSGAVPCLLVVERDHDPAGLVGAKGEVNIPDALLCSTHGVRQPNHAKVLAAAS